MKTTKIDTTANCIDIEQFNKDDCIKRYKLDDMNVVSSDVLVFIYKGSIMEKTSHGILLPDSSKTEDDEYYSKVGLVLQIGKYAYPSDAFSLGPMCNVGDWILFKRIENKSLFRSCGNISDPSLPLLGLIPDTAVLMVINDPRLINNP